MQRYGPSPASTLAIALSAATLLVVARTAWGQAPSARYFHTAVLDVAHERMLVFGGDDIQSGLSNSVHALVLGDTAIWTTLAPLGTLPGPRLSHTAIYDPVRDRMIVFGGYDYTNGRLDDLWELQLSGVPTWNRLTPVGPTPVARNLHSAIYDPVRDRMIVFGGYRTEAYLNDVWALSLSGPPTWTPLAPVGPVPAPRREHTAIYDPVGDRMIVYGGKGFPAGDSDLWALSLSGTPAWSPITATGSPPQGRWGHTAVYDPVLRTMVVHAGSDVQYLDDTWELSLDGAPAWRELLLAPPVPAPRVYSAAIADPSRGRVVMFGGLGYPTMDPATWALWLYPVPAWRDITLPAPALPTAPNPTFLGPVSGIPASMYAGQSFTLAATVRNDGSESDDGRIVVGFPTLTDPASVAWVTSSSAGDLPGFRTLPPGSSLEQAGCLPPITSTYLVAEYADTYWEGLGAETNTLVLTVRVQTPGTFYVEVRSTMHRSGGVACDWESDVPFSGGTLTVDQQGWQVRRFAIAVDPPPGDGTPPGPRGYHSAIPDPAHGRMLVFGGAGPDLSNQVWSLTLGASPDWSLLQPAGVPPTARSGHTAILDPVRDRMLVFAGVDQNFLADVWALSLTIPMTWTQLAPLGTAPPPRQFHTAIYDPAGDRMLVFGGEGLGVSNDVWALALSGVPTWSQLPVTGDPPVLRKRHAAIHDPVRQRMLVFGGLLSGFGGPALNELWSLDLSGEPRWSQLSVGEVVPSGRWGHTMSYDPAGDRVWVFGGSATSMPFYDLWSLALAPTPSWQREFGWGTQMEGRHGHSAITDAPNGRLVLFGGSSYLGPMNDTWFLSLGRPPVWRRLNGTPPPVPPDAPIPTFTQPVASVHFVPLPSSILLGESLDVLLTVRNDGLTSDDGRITVSFPTLTDPGDGQWVSGSGGYDLPGHLEHPAGASIQNSTCQPMVASYLVADYADAEWLPFGLDEKAITLTVRPRAVGEFHLDVRSTMHEAWGAPCEIAHGLPPNGQGGHTDQQGWAVRRFTVNVLPAPTEPIPVFTTPVTPLPSVIALGQTFVLTLSARNDGAASDDGRIVVGFPAFTGTGDDLRVTSTSSGDLPGYREFPAGSTLADAACQPLTAPYLFVEYADEDWTWRGLEVNTLTLTIQPAALGAFEFDVRSTMRTAGAGPCAYVNGVPAGGQAITDPLGWEVRRFSLAVVPVVPDPTFTGNVSLVPTSMALGQSFTLTTTVRNQGGQSDDGRISVSFPSLTVPSDIQWVSSTSAGDTPGYREYGAGASIEDRYCQPMVASYLTVEYADDDWRGGGSEGNQLVLTVQPQAEGTFTIYVRSTMRAAGATCAYINDRPPGATVDVDQQGWEVTVLTVQVGFGPASAPIPVFPSAVVGLPTNITLGESIQIYCTVRNDGALADDGRIHLAFPTLTDPGDHQYASSTTTGATPGYVEQPAGFTVQSSGCQPMAAPWLMVEYQDNAWNRSESWTLNVTVQPRAVGAFRIQVRALMHGAGAAPCNLVNATPNIGPPLGSLVIDAQGWQAREFVITVDPAGPGPVPTPTFVGPVTGLPLVVTLGESFTIMATARNDGVSTSDDGIISFGFPSLVSPSDDRWVMSGSAGDQPGYVERPQGSIVIDAACQPRGADYLVAEYVDTEWLVGESNTFAAVVQPRAAGTFYVDVRCTLRYPSGGSCNYVNTVPFGGTGTVTDQQGRGVRRFEVQVVAPPEPPGQATTTWTQIGPFASGPTGRAGSTAIYHPLRQSLIVYGGADPVYLGDVWQLPLAGGGGWAPVVAGGPPPLRRIQHSTIYNALDDQAVIFGGFYHDYLNDLTVLAFTGQPWWFPNPGYGSPPPGRGGHAALYDPVRHRMLVIGGFGGTFRNDVWEYAPPGAGTWRELTPGGGPMPARSQHAAVYDPVRDRVLVIGGDGGTFLNDVWALELGGELRWQPIHPTGNAPSARREHTAIYDPVGDRVIVFGGNDGALRGDLWQLSLGAEPRWSLLGSSTLPPSLRTGHCAVYDTPRRRMLVFGGDVGTGQLSNEVWALTFEAPTAVTVALASVEATPERVRLEWTFTATGPFRTEVSRALEGSEEWRVLGSATVDGDRLVVEDRAVEPGQRYGYRLTVWEGSEATEVEAAWVTVPRPAVLSLAGAFPNPSEGELEVGFSLAGAEAASLELFDLRGRRVAVREVGALGSGEHRVRIEEARGLPAGVYLVRLRQHGRVLTAKASVVR